MIKIGNGAFYFTPFDVSVTFRTKGDDVVKLIRAFPIVAKCFKRNVMMHMKELLFLVAYPASMLVSLACLLRLFTPIFSVPRVVIVVWWAVMAVALGANIGAKKCLPSLYGLSTSEAWWSRFRSCFVAALLRAIFRAWIGLKKSLSALWTNEIFSFTLAPEITFSGTIFRIFSAGGKSEATSLAYNCSCFSGPRCFTLTIGRAIYLSLPVSLIVLPALVTSFCSFWFFHRCRMTFSRTIHSVIAGPRGGYSSTSETNHIDFRHFAHSLKCSALEFEMGHRPREAGSSAGSYSAQALRGIIPLAG